jgi:hypothetical protein
MLNKCLAVLVVAVPLCAQVTVTRATDRISVNIDGKPFTDFFIGADAPKPYLHPLRAASGTAVTRYFPMQKIAGESTDHLHHMGLWFAHGDVNGVDFWSSEPGDNRQDLGRFVLRKVGELKSGSKTGSLSAAFDWIGPKKNLMLTDTRTIVFYADPKLRMMDFDIQLTAVEKVKFGDTKEGTFAIRVASGLEALAKNSPPNPPRTGQMVDSEGRQGEANVWGKRASWVDVYGEVDGEKLGIAIMDHPSNARYPTYWHCRDYGLCAANMFGTRDFLADKTLDGGLTLQPGEKLHLRYRVVIHPGDPQSANVAALFRAFAATK